MASIHKGRGTRWCVRWRTLDGASNRSRTCPDKRTATALQREIEQAHALGREWVPESESAGAVPELRQILSAYITERSLNRAPRTRETMGQHLDTFLGWLTGRQSGSRLLPSVFSKSLLLSYYRSLATGGRWGRSRNLSTRRKMTMAVLAAWQWAADDEEYARFMPRPPSKLELPREPGKPTVAPTFEEMDRCIAASSGWHRQLLVVLRFTGLRVQQAMFLRWSDFDLDRQMLNIRGELGKSRSERQGRIVPISEHLANEMAGWGRREGWVIKSARQRGGERERMARTRDVNRAWARSGVRDEVWKGRPHHSFRKGLVTGLKRLGADTEAAEYLVGHVLPGVRGVYVDPEAHGLRDAVALIPPIQTSFPVAVLDRARSALVPQGVELSAASGSKSKKPRTLRVPGASDLVLPRELSRSEAKAARFIAKWDTSGES